MRRRKREKLLRKTIAKSRIEELFKLAEEEALKGRIDRADRYVELARKISMKYQVRIPKRYKLFFCKKCYHFLLPEVTCRVRINRGKLVIYCYNCKNYRRIPSKSSATLK